MAKLPFVINDGKWHHICVTWTTRDGVWEAYQDGTQTGNGENLAPYHPIKPQGVLVLGQEQVRAGGCPRSAGCTWGMDGAGGDGAAQLHVPCDICHSARLLRRTRWAAGSTPRRPSWGSWRTSTCGTGS